MGTQWRALRCPQTALQGHAEGTYNPVLGARLEAHPKSLLFHWNTMCTLMLPRSGVSTECDAEQATEQQLSLNGSSGSLLHPWETTVYLYLSYVEQLRPPYLHQLLS